ncbi:MAG: hypothetical protein U0353_02185 [Sandaracinus sp.]
MAQSPFIANVAEFFTLEAASRTVDGIGDAARKRIHDSLALGRQKATCAETLWANGHTAEGLALAAGALDATLAAAPDVTSRAGAPSAKAAAAEPAAKPSEPGAKPSDEAAKPSDEAAKPSDEAAKPSEPDDKPSEADDKPGAPAPWSDVLSARGVSKADLEAIRSAQARAQERLPLLDRDVSPGHAELFVERVRARQRADRALAPAAMSHRDLRWTRVLRAAGALVLGGLAIAGLYYGLRTPTGTFASASDFFQQSPQFAPENAIDGSPATYWLLPDGATGWLEVSTSPPRHVGRVRVLNTTNPPWSDRGTNQYQIEVYVHGEVARTIDGTFEWTESPAPVDHQVDLDDVERVRFVVRSHHRVGAGLAELSLD